MKKGDIIFSASQTQDLLNHGKTTGHARAYASGSVTSIPAYASTNTGGAFKIKGQVVTSNTKNNSTASAVQKTASDAGKAVEKASDDTSDLVDWIKVKLDRLQRQTDRFLSKAELAVGVNKKLSQYSNATDNIDEQIKYNKQADKAYRKQAKSYGKEVNLKSGIIKKIQNGTIDINKYDEETRKKITEYQKWWELALQAQDEILKLKQQRKEIEQDRLDAITDAYEASQGLYDAIKSGSEAMTDYYTSIGKAVNSKDAKKQIKTQMTYQAKSTQSIQDEINRYKTELKNAKKVFGTNSVEYKEAYTKLKELNTALTESKTAYNDLKKQIYALDMTRLEYAINSLSDFGERLSSIVDLKIARGGLDSITEDDYNKQITNNNDMIVYYQKQRDNALKELREMKYEEGSDEYERVRSEAEAATLQILKLAQANEQFKDSIRELRWKPFNDLQTSVSEAIEELDHLRSLMKEEQFLDDKAQITGRGYANIALIADAMDLATQQIADYLEALAKLEKERKEGNITQDEYNDLSRQYIGIIRNSVTAVENYKDALVDLYEKQVTKENEILQKNITLRKEALKRKKEYYDYDKTLKKQSKDVNNLMAQIAALEGVQNQASQAELARLKAQLADSQEALQDTVNDHEYEVRVTGYEKLSDDANEALDDTLNAIKANADKQQAIVDLMLRKIKDDYVTTYTAVNGTLDGTVAVNQADVDSQFSATDSMLTQTKSAYKAAYEEIDKIIGNTGTVLEETSANALKALGTLGEIGNYTIPTPREEVKATSTDKIGRTETSSGMDTTPIVNQAARGETFKEQISATSISLNKKSLSLEVGKTAILKATAKPSGAVTSCSWSSSNKKVATVSGGTVAAKDAGSATITVTDKTSGKSASCSVTVTYAQLKGRLTTTSGMATTKQAVSVTYDQLKGQIKTTKGVTTTKQAVSTKTQASQSAKQEDAEFYAKSATLKSKLAAAQKSGNTQQINSIMEEISRLEAQHSKAQKLAKAGYATGGIVGAGGFQNLRFSNKDVSADILRRSMRFTGDDGLAFLSKGETVLTEKFTNVLPQAVKSMDQFVKMYDETMRGITSNVIQNVGGATNNITVYYGSLINVESGAFVDKTVISDLEEIAVSMSKNKKLLESNYKYTSKRLAKEMGKL